MTFDFYELNALSSDGRYQLYESDPQSIEEILLYYLCPLCPARQYHELQNVVHYIGEIKFRPKMTSLLFGASAIRNDGLGYQHNGNDVQLIDTYKVKPPTDRLGGLYDDCKLQHVLSGMDRQIRLPAMALDRNGGDKFDYSVRDGIHRYYASIRLGYGKLPATIWLQ